NGSRHFLRRLGSVRETDPRRPSNRRGSRLSLLLSASHRGLLALHELVRQPSAGAAAVHALGAVAARRIGGALDGLTRLPAAGDAPCREAKGAALPDRRCGAAVGGRPAAPLCRVLEQAAPFHPIALDQFAD